MLWIVLYLLSIVACYFIGRKTMKIDVDFFLGHPFLLVLYMGLSLLPYGLNVIGYLVVLYVAWDENGGSDDFDPENFLRKLFNIKE